MNIQVVKNRISEMQMKLDELKKLNEELDKSLDTNTNSPEEAERLGKQIVKLNKAAKVQYEEYSKLLKEVYGDF